MIKFDESKNQRPPNLFHTMMIVENEGKLFLVCDKGFNKTFGVPSQIVCGDVTYTIIKNSRRIDSKSMQQSLLKSLSNQKISFTSDNYDINNFVIAGKLSRSKNALQKNNHIQKLSNREKQILHLIAQGMSSKAIAIELDISSHTVNSYHKTIYRKLDVKSKIQALVTAKSLGII
jgi:DNA-binding CsgD family transcriptional regulator